MGDFPDFNFNFCQEVSDDDLSSMVLPEVDIEPDKTNNANDLEKQSRFAKLSESEVDDIITKSETKHTKENTKWAVGVFEGN